MPASSHIPFPAPGTAPAGRGSHARRGPLPSSTPAAQIVSCRSSFAETADSAAARHRETAAGFPGLTPAADLPPALLFLMTAPFHVERG